MSSAAEQTAPTVPELREELVQRGDFVGVYESIVQAKWSEIDLTMAFSQLLRAIDVASRDEPGRFADEVLRVMLSLCTYVMMRAQYAIIHGIAQHDEENSASAARLSNEMLAEALPQLQSIHAHVVELNRARATTARLWQLAKQKEIENDVAESRRAFQQPMIQRKLMTVEVLPQFDDDFFSQPNQNGAAPAALFNDAVGAARTDDHTAVWSRDGLRHSLEDD